MTEEEYFRKYYPDYCYGDRLLSPYWDLFQYGVEFGERQSEKKIEELEETINKLREQLALRYSLEDKIKELEKQIEKMKCCGNCKYGYCGGSSISIDKDGNRTFHNWNEEKEDYCDVGKNGKYQCCKIFIYNLIFA